MRVVIQRVSEASVSIGGKLKSSIGKGLLVLLGVGREDGDEDIDWLVKKISGLRIFDDEAGVMNRSVVDTGSDIIVVSQFTLMASTKKGNRPSYMAAAGHEYRSLCMTGSAPRFQRLSDARWVQANLVRICRFRS